MATVVIVPGLGNSGPDHWQTRLERALGEAARRVDVGADGWDKPEMAAWLMAIEATVQRAPEPVVLVAHSLGCIAVAHWAREGAAPRVAGALLVAPPDVDDDARVPSEVLDFAPLPMLPLPFPAVVVASSDDPFMDLDRARSVAAAWGARFEDAGAAGHLNSDSGHGPWPRAEEIVRDLML